MNMQLLRWSKAKPETTEQATRLERHSYLTRDWMPRTILAIGIGDGPGTLDCAVKFAALRFRDCKANSQGFWDMVTVDGR